MKFLKLFLCCLMAFLLFPRPASAGGGYVRIESDADKGTLGKPLAVRAFLLDQDALKSTQNIQIKIKNQRSSDNCTMSSSVVNESGFVSALCSSTEEGTVAVYAEWVEGGSVSETKYITFQREDASVQVVKPAATDTPAQQSNKPRATAVPTVAPTEQPADLPVEVEQLLEQDPADFEIPAKPDLSVPVAMIAAGGVLTAAGIAVLLFSQKNRRASKKKLAGILSVGGVLLVLVGSAWGLWLIKTTSSAVETMIPSPSPSVVASASPLATASPSLEPTAVPTPTPVPVVPITVKLSGELIHDKNCNYVKDAGEPGLADVPINIYAFDPPRGNELLATLRTDSNGYFTYSRQIMSNQTTTIQADYLVIGYGMNNFPQMPGAVTLSAKNKSVHQLHPLFFVEGDCWQEARN